MSYVYVFRTYIPKYFTENSSMYNFIELLNNNNDIIVKRLALYCFKAFEKRNVNLYNCLPFYVYLFIYLRQ